MLGSLNILNALLHNSKLHNLKILIENSIKIEITDYNIFKKYAIDKFDQYVVGNIKKYSY